MYWAARLLVCPPVCGRCVSTGCGARPAVEGDARDALCRRFESTLGRLRRYGCGYGSVLSTLRSPRVSVRRATADFLRSFWCFLVSYYTLARQKPNEQLRKHATDHRHKLWDAFS